MPLAYLLCKKRRGKGKREYHDKKFQEGCQLLSGTTAMTYAVFLLRSHLSETDTCLNRGKYRIVAEAVGSCLFLQNLTFHYALEQMLLAFLDKGYNSAETCTPILLVLKLIEQTADVGIGIVTFTISVHVTKAGSIYARCTIKSINLETCIISKAVHAIVIVNVSCFLQSITLKCVGRLGNIFMATDICQTTHLKPSGKYLSDFAELMLVVGCHYKLFHPFLILSKPSPNTPSTLLIVTKAFGSIIRMSWNISRLSCLLAIISSTLRGSLLYQPSP